MAPRIFFGVNLNFAKHVYGRKRALEVARRQLGVRHVEMVTDNDFGPVLYLRTPGAFREFHYDVADHAKTQGVAIPSVFTVFRDTGAIAYGSPEIRESAYFTGLSLLEQAACYRAKYAGAALFTMNKEEAEDPERYQALFYYAIETWKRWMGDAHRLGVGHLLLETTSTFREGCSTIDDTRASLECLDEFHEKNPGSTVPVGVCYNTGHGISPTESRDEADRDFRAWFQAFPDRIHQIHLRNTDEHFVKSWHLGKEGGIISPLEVFQAIRDDLTLPEVYVYLGIPGRRGREVSERRTIRNHIKSIEIVQGALRELGYEEDEDLGWSLKE